jgi:hypothetical protein
MSQFEIVIFNPKYQAMQKLIWKLQFTVEQIPDMANAWPGKEFEVEIPPGSKVIHVEAQPEFGIFDIQCWIGAMWVLFNAEYSEHREKRWFKLCHTGKLFELSDHDEYVGSYQTINTGIVCHIFECKKSK